MGAGGAGLKEVEEGKPYEDREFDMAMGGRKPQAFGKEWGLSMCAYEFLQSPCEANKPSWSLNSTL